MTRFTRFIIRCRLRHGLRKKILAGIIALVLSLLPTRGLTEAAGLDAKGENSVEKRQPTLALPGVSGAETESFALRQVLGTYGGSWVDYAPDGRHVVTAGSGVVYIIETQSYRIEKQLIAEDTAGTSAVRWSPDGQYVAAESVIPLQIHIWDVEKEQIVRMLPGVDAKSLAWSPDGSRLAACSRSSLRILEVKSGQILRTLAGGNSVAWSPDGQYVVTGSNTDVLIYEVETGHIVQRLQRHNSVVQAVAWSPDGQYVASGGFAPFDGTIKVWEVATGTMIRTFIHGDPASILWSPDGTYLAGGGGWVRIWEMERGDLIYMLGEGMALGIHSIAWSPNGQQIVSGGSWIVNFWDMPTGGLLQTLQGHRGELTSVTWSPDGRSIASAATDYLNDRSIRIWDTETGDAVRVIRDDVCRRGFNAVEWSPDGRYLASALLCSQPSIIIWEAATMIERTRWSGSLVYALAWSPDGNYLAFIASDRKLRIFARDTWAVVQTLEDPTGLELQVAWSPDGKYLACRANGRDFKIFAVDDWRVIHTLQGRTRVASPAWSPDSQYLAALDGTSFAGSDLVQIWAVETEALVRTIEREAIRTLTRVAWSPDGRYLAAGEGQAPAPRRITIWTTQTGEEVQRLVGHGSDIISVRWSRDGNYLASASLDRTLRLWIAPKAQLKAKPSPRSPHEKLPGGRTESHGLHRPR